MGGGGGREQQLVAYSFSVYMYRFHIWSDTDIFKSSSGTLLAYVKLFVCLFVCLCLMVLIISSYHT